MKVQPSQNLRPTVASRAVGTCPTNPVPNALQRHLKTVMTKLSMFQANKNNSDRHLPYALHRPVGAGSSRLYQPAYILCAGTLHEAQDCGLAGAFCTHTSPPFAPTWLLFLAKTRCGKKPEFLLVSEVPCSRKARKAYVSRTRTRGNPHSAYCAATSTCDIISLMRVND
jgi:hypothetical protein